MESGIERARKVIARGEARQKLEDFIAFTKTQATA
jgi:anthranilate phosphoribosyltransferase